MSKHVPPTRTLPHPIAMAHLTMVAKLAAIKPPRIYVSPTPDEFGAVADYIEAVARIMDEWHLLVGEEVKSNSTVRIDMTLFTDVFRDATEGLSVFEAERPGKALNEDRGAAMREARTEFRRG